MLLNHPLGRKYYTGLTLQGPKTKKAALILLLRATSISLKLYYIYFHIQVTTLSITFPA
ncbi:hypothetical protein HLPCO_000924 [Haloplasma contractile SSD-17B]|uniref:Uncharacterized protein n=1 Tax=Haloplasma contractile SSD-17B TaxID=1033810 RepID=U2FKF8_9MOLU|nr:hypothetical protein HLPCO_000924 [Haloplasma contractile SSD-17B]